MVEAADTTDRQHRGSWQFSLRTLFLLVFSVALGLSFWKMEQDWYIGVLAAVSVWFVCGLVAQMRDIRSGFAQCGTLTTEERWGWRFAFAWRTALCCMIVICFVVRPMGGFHSFRVNDSYDSRWDFADSEAYNLSTRTMWNAVLLGSMIAAILGSRGFPRAAWRPPWSWGVHVLRGFIASLLLLVILEERQLYPYLVHLTIVGIL